MARKSRPHLRPRAELNEYQLWERNFARSLNMRDEYQLRRYLKRVRSLPHDDPRYVPVGLDQRTREQAIKRSIRRDRVEAKYGRTETRKLISKIKGIVDRGVMSPFIANEKYRKMMMSLINDRETSAYDKQKLRDLLLYLKAGYTAPDAIGVPEGDQGTLF